MTSCLPKLIASCYCPMDHLCQFASKSVNNFSKYRVYKSGNRRRNREIDRQVDNIMPPRASTARRCPYDPTVPVRPDGPSTTRRCQYGPTVPVRPDGASMARWSQYNPTVPVQPDGPSMVPVWHGGGKKNNVHLQKLQQLYKHNPKTYYISITIIS